MWTAKYCSESEISQRDINHLVRGQIPAIILQNFYEKTQCIEISNRILSIEKPNFMEGKLKHIGPFLMAHTTRKKKYFEKTKQSQKIFKKIFRSKHNPTSRIFSCLENIFPEHVLSIAKEDNQEMSPFVIRIHENGKSIPIHKDNVKYEGIEFDLSKIDYQLSCVLHLQESKLGGELIVYDKNWKKEDEKHRKIEFGYSNKIVENSKSCKLSNVKQGDLVIINPNNYHQVTKISGNLPRISLGMFIGLLKEKQQIVSWA